MGRLLLQIFWSVVLLLGSFGIWLTATESGTRWLLQQAIAQSPYPLGLKGISGTLVDKISFESLSFEKDQLQVDVSHGQIDWQLKKLLRKQLWIDELSAQTLRIQLPAKEEPPTTKTPLKLPIIDLPVTLAFQNLSVDSLQLVPPQTSGGNRQTITIERINGSAQLAGSQLSLNRLSLEHRGYHAHAGGNMLFEAKPSLDLNLALSKLSTPESQIANPGQNPPTSQPASQLATAGKSLQARVTGPLSGYEIHLQSELPVDALPPYSLTLEGKGDFQHLKIEAMNLDMLDGKLQGQGSVQWEPELLVDMELEAQNINPGVWKADYTGNINGNITLSATPADARGSVTAQGTLRNYPLKINSQFSADRLIANASTKNRHHLPRVTLKDTTLRLGENSLDLLGRFTAERAELLKFTLKAPQLSRLHPQLQGRMEGSGSLRGKWTSPDINARFAGTGIQWQENTIEALKVEVLPDLWAFERSRHKVDIRFEKVGSSKHKVDQILVTGTASPERQSLSFTLLAPKALKLSGDLGGTLDLTSPGDPHWQGSITRLDLEAKNLPQYSLQSPSNLSLTPTTQRLTPLCLASPDKSNDESLCLSASRSKPKQAQIGEIQLVADISGFPVKRFAPWWPASRQIKKRLNHHTELSGDDSGLLVSSRTVFDGNNSLKAELQINPKTRSLQGNIKGGFDQLQWLELVTDEIVSPQGRVTADIQLAGSLDKVLANGRLGLDDISLKLPVTGTRISEGALNLDLESAQKAKLQGTMKIDGQPLALKGSGQWTTFADWSTQLKLNGDRVRVMNTKEAKVYASPDLTLDASAKRIHLSGKLRIPRADITPGELPPDAVIPSEDEYIITRNQEKKPQRGIPLSMDVTVKVGDSASNYPRKEAHKHRVRFDGFGLKTDLQGTLRVTQNPFKKPQGDGRLKVVNGNYRAYGQDLQIRRGEIYFNGPLSSPGFNIEAVRDTGEVVAGIRLRGTTDNLESALFSVPTLSDTDVLSYLLTGQSFQEQGSKGDNQTLLLSAATRFGLKSSGDIFQRLKSNTKLDTLQVQAGSDIEQSALLIGKYLTPNLYVQYALKLFEENDIISLRYQLSKHLQLEAESGTSQGIDLIYQIER